VARSTTKAPKSAVKSIIELVLTVAIAVGLALLIQAFIVKPYRIPSPSMVPTLDVGQRVLTNRLINHPSVGDVVVFHPPKGADPQTPICGNPNQGEGHDQACARSTPGESSQTFIKRVVGGPGDRISIQDGHVIRNGVREHDPYAVSCTGSSACNLTTTIRVPAGEYYMMGDNRPDSEDSRYWGPVPRKWIIGRAILTYWPPGRLGFL